MSASRLNEKVCFICGAGHSGSTVLGMVLGSHSGCFYAGEAGKTRYLDDRRKDERKRVCKMCGADCPVWGRFQVAAGRDLYEEISRVTGCPTVIDSTKGLDWLSARIAELGGTTARPHLLFLLRDGRAVINSRLRKYPDREPRELIRHWADQIRRTTAAFEAFTGPKRILRYEVFASAPDATVRELCDFLGMDHEPAMLEFYRHDHHPLGGNNGAQHLVARTRGAKGDRPYAELSSRNRAYYERHEMGIKLDDRWRRELSPEVLRLFEDLVGDLNADMRWEAQ